MTGDDANPEKLKLANRTSPISSLNSLFHKRTFLSNTANSSRSSLQGLSTTAVTSVNIQTLAFPDGSRGTFSTAPTSPSSSLIGASDGKCTPKNRNQPEDELDDSNSTVSHHPTFRASGDLISLLDERLHYQSPAWIFLSTQGINFSPSETIDISDIPLHNFEKEFDEINSIMSEGQNEEEIILEWKTKYKHYLILSSAGKPIFSRHGDQNLINSYMGIIQTIISFYQGSNNTLLGFSTEGTRFVISIFGPLYLVAISRLGESDSQLRVQLQALYMQILSTLTLPTLTQLFTTRPNTDLRRPLEGTEALLSCLADTFTKGSPSTLLSSLECLTLPKLYRNMINSSLLKARSEKLLYGLIVARRRLVSVIRPKGHSLYPSDLQLIFNMLFEANGVRAGGGENWVPLCLPGFNNRGYLYMYVSFFGISEENGLLGPSQTKENLQNKDIVFVLISTDKEGFFDLRRMRDNVLTDLERNGSLDIIKRAIREGRRCLSKMMHRTHLRHFLFKSCTNVQFVMPDFPPNSTDVIGRRRLMTLYHNLHASVHTRYSHLKVLHCVNRGTSLLAWCTPTFELYCVASSKLSRAIISKEANQIVQWVKREEQRLFIIGGAVF